MKNCQASVVFALTLAFLLPANAASPLSPAEALKSFRLADTNLVIELVAAEPDVRAPVAVTWDADGRMFVAEMTDYPSGPVNGRIRLLEDRDGDGRYESSLIFATNLAYPNGVMAWKNGVLVTAAPDIWFLADTNDDGRADMREKVLTGFAEGNQQLRVNGLLWGLDNWIYGCNGRSDGEVKWADGTPAGSIRHHDFRFRPDTKQFEVIAGNSQFGMGYDDWGNRFPVFNNTPIRHVVIEDHYLSRQPSLAGMDNVPAISPPDGNRVFALTPPTLLIPQPVGFFTSACGPSIYRGTAMPESYRGNYFVCEPVQNVVQRRLLKPNGSTFIAEYASTNQEFLASTDRWFHGVFTATGPDGAFYVVDFYRDLVEHPHWVAPEIRDQVDWRKGEEHGRIWRIRAKNAKPGKVEKLSNVSNDELVRALERSNGWTRDTAHRLLVERSARDMVPQLQQLAMQDHPAQAKVHALYMLNELHGLVPRVVEAGLEDKHPRVREHAVRFTGQFTSYAFEWNDYERARFQVVRLASDPDERVRLQVALALGQFRSGTQILPTRQPNIFSDPLWYAKTGQETIWGLGPLNHIDVPGAFLRIANQAQFDSWQSLAVVAGLGVDPWPFLERADWMLENGSNEQLQLLARLCAAIAEGKRPRAAQSMVWWLGQSRSLNRLIPTAAFVGQLPSPEQKTAVGRFGAERLLADAVGVVTNSSAPLPLRLAALRLIELSRAADAGRALPALFNSMEPEALQTAAVRALVEWEDGEDWLTPLALQAWNESSRAARRQMVASSLKGVRSALALLDLIEGGRIFKPEIDSVARQTLLKHRDVTVAARAKMIFKETVSPDREAVVAKYRAALKLTGERARGAAQFERACLVCHQMQGVGAKVGPDLSGIGTHSRETLLVEILEPSRQVLPDFVAYHAETKAGDTYTGFLANESAMTVTLRRANEPDITLPRTELKQLKTSGQSLMPEGLETGMSEQDMADLIEFLRRPDRTLFTQPK